MKHFLLAAFLIGFVKGNLSNLATNLTPPLQYPKNQNDKLQTSASEQLQTKRSPIAFPQPEFNFPQGTINDQFLQTLQQSENDLKGNYGVPAPQRYTNNNNNNNQIQDSYKHQDLEEDSEEEDSPEKYGAPDKVKLNYDSSEVQSAYGAPQSQSLNQNVQNVKYLSGFLPSYGPPTKSPHDILQNLNSNYEQEKHEGSKIFKHVSVHVAPQLEQTNRAPRIIRPLGKSNEKHYNIIFIKAPDALIQEDTEVHLPPPPQQKTVVYLLAKNQEQKANIKLATPAPTQVAAPEVYFVKYQDNKKGKNSQYEKAEPTYGPPMPNAYFPLASPSPTSFASVTYPSQNIVYGTPAQDTPVYDVPVLSPATSYSTPSNSYVTLNPTFAPTQVFSTFPSASPATTLYGNALNFQPVTLDEIENSNNLQQARTNTQFVNHNIQHHLGNRLNFNHVHQQEQQTRQENQDNRLNYNHQQQQRQENHENHQKEQQQQQNQLHQGNHQQQNQPQINHNNNNNFQPSRQIFGNSAPLQYNNNNNNKPPVQEEQREYQLTQPPSQQSDYIIQAPFRIEVPNHHFQTPVPEQSGEYSSTTVTAATAQLQSEEEHIPLVFEATRTTSRLNNENNSELEKPRPFGRRRKVKRGRSRKRMRKVKKSKRNKDQALNHNQH